MNKPKQLRRDLKRAVVFIACIAETLIMAGAATACATKDNNAVLQQEKAPVDEILQEQIQSNITQQDTKQTEAGGDEQQISLDDAKQAALADAGVAASDVVYTKERSDYEDGIAVYDIEFYADNVEYEYEIDAVTGEVYSKSMEAGRRQAERGRGGNAETSGTAETPEAYIEPDSAKVIALEHAGFSETDVSRIKAEFDIDDGWAVYEIEFYKDSREYEYTIDAIDGSVMEYDVD